MSVSVIIPTHNRGYVLTRALSSIVNQTFKPLEVLVIDDGSTDDTYSKTISCKNKHFPLRYLRIPHRGVSYARNYGIRQAEGDWIAFLDSDDEWLPDKLQQQLTYLHHHPRIQIVHGDEIWIRRGTRVNTRQIHRKSGGFIFTQCLKRCLISPSAVLAKKSLLTTTGLFDETFPVCEDYDLWLRITFRFEIGFVSQAIIIKHGGHPDQLSSKYPVMDYYRIIAMHRLLPSLSSHVYKTALYTELCHKAKIVLRGYVKHHNFANFAKIFRIYMLARRQLSQLQSPTFTQQ